MTEAPIERDRPAPILAARGIAKSFGGARALRGVDFTLYGGEVHALLGENGAGKTTLMNILSGAHAPDQGELAIDGKSVRFADPREAQAVGISTIYQELDLVPSLDVAANLFLGHELLRHGFLDKAAKRASDSRRLIRTSISTGASRIVDWPSSNRRHRQGAVKGGAGPDHGRADRRADLQRSRMTVQDHARSQRDGRRDHLHIASPGRGARRRRSRHRHARRPDRGRETSPKAPQAEIVQLLVGRPLGELYPKRTGNTGRRLLNLERARFRLRRRRAGWQPCRDHGGRQDRTFVCALRHRARRGVGGNRRRRRATRQARLDPRRDARASPSSPTIAAAAGSCCACRSAEIS
jgi:ribose transport system ATP-binding protein